jgi:hypothetical protein
MAYGSGRSMSRSHCLGSQPSQAQGNHDLRCPRPYLAAGQGECPGGLELKTPALYSSTSSAVKACIGVEIRPATIHGNQDMVVCRPCYGCP